MKYILSFLFGAGCGAGGMLLWLRKDIKKELESREKAEKCDEMPFTMGEGTDNTKEVKAAVGPENGLRSETNEKIAYHKIIAETKENPMPVSMEKGPIVAVTPREEDIFKKKPEPTKEFVDTIPISKDEFKEDNGNEKEHLVYFRGDRVMAFENGTIMPNPAMLIGTTWENYIGDYAPRTAYIRNPNLVTDYEIMVEDGLYEDEYGTDYLRED